MDHPKSKAVLELDIADPNSISQLRMWGYLPDVPLDPPPEDAEEAVARLREAIESHDAVEVRDTDLDIISQFLSTKQPARLYVPKPDGEGVVGIAVEYCKTQLGEIVIPWTSESITDLLVGAGAYLKPKGQPKIYFADTRDLFFGGKKAFVVCEPREADDGSKR